MDSPSEQSILVTGFGPFLNIKTNPSHQIVSLLPGIISNTRIITTPTPLKAAYHSLLSIPALIEKHQPSAIIHVGLAVERDYFAIEQGASRDGYHQIPDEERKVFTKSESKAKWGKGPESLRTSFDVEELQQKWQRNVKPAGSAGKLKKGKKDEMGKEGKWELRTSDDVGSYVCGFVYYASLEWCWRNWGDRRPVLFLHIPMIEGKEELEKGRDVLVRLIKAVVESL